MENGINWIQALDDIQMRLACGIDTACAMQELMNSGPCAADSYADALYGACDHLRMLNEKLAETIDGMRAEGGAVAV